MDVDSTGELAISLDMAREVLRDNNILEMNSLESLEAILVGYEIGHLKTMVETTDKDALYRSTSKTDFVDIQMLSEIFQHIYEARLSLSTKKKMSLTNHAVDWTLGYLYDIKKYKHVRFVSTVEYEYLERRLDTLQELSKNIVIPTSDLVTLFSYDKKLDAKLRRKAIGSETFSKLEIMNALADARNVGPSDPKKTMIDSSNDVYSAVMMKLVDNHFSFVIFDAETSDRTSEPTMVYFDSLNMSVTPEKDSMIAQISGICNMVVPPMHTVLGVDQPLTDAWSCGYRSLSRVIDISKWLNDNRKYDVNRMGLLNDTPIENSNTLAAKSIDESRCRHVAEFVLLRTAAALLYLDLRARLATN